MLIRIFVASFLILVAAVMPAAADDALQSVMNSLHDVTSARGTFVEKKYLRILNEPLESSGVLAYTAPDRLEKKTERPSNESLVVVGDELIVSRGGDQQRTLKLTEHPEIEAFVESVRATLAGNIDVLRRYYTVALEGDAGQWTLTLVPAVAEMRKMIKTVTLKGGNGLLQSVAIDEADGDRSVMTVTPTTP